MSKPRGPREAPVGSSRAYYRQFDLRAGEINKEKQGILLRAARDGAACPRETAPESGGDGTPPAVYKLRDRGDVEEIVSEVLRLLNRFPEAREILLSTITNHRVYERGKFSEKPFEVGEFGESNLDRTSYYSESEERALYSHRQ